jgi:hypothetical protein
MYKASDIKPKRYPDEKPSKYGIFFGYPSNDGDWFDYIYPCTYPWSERPIQWFIDIPGAPPELKPLAYPESLPPEIGRYWVHREQSDKWEVLGWGIWGTEHPDRVDYFIPVNIKDDEMEKPPIEWNTIWETDSFEVIDVKRGDRSILTISNPLTDDALNVKGKELTAFARHWLSLVEEEARQPDWGKENKMETKIGKQPRIMKDGNAIAVLDKNFINLQESESVWFNSQDEFEQEVIHWLDLQGYEVTRKEPELKACPNPTCEQTKFLEIVEVPSMYSHPNKAFIVECKNCGYRGGRGSSKEQAVKLHNLIADKSRRNGEE